MTSGRHLTHMRLFAGLVLAATSLGSAAAANEIAQGEFEVEPVLENVPVGLGHRLKPHGDGFLLLDRVNHRLLMLDRSGAVERQVGRVGQAPGELRFPMDYAVGPTGVIRVLTTEEVGAIHSFSTDGTFLGVRHLGDTVAAVAALRTHSLAVDSEDRVWINAPRTGSPLARYLVPDGEPEAIGALLRPVAVFPDCEQHERCRDRRFITSLNRATLAPDGAGGVVAAFTAAPIVRRYTGNGELAFETRLSGEMVDELMGVAMQDPEAWRPYQPFSITADPVKALAMVYGVAVDPSTGLIYCTVGARQLYVLSSGGEQIAILTQRESSAALVSLSVVDGVAWLVGNTRLYRASLPDVQP